MLEVRSKNLEVRSSNLGDKTILWEIRHSEKWGSARFFAIKYG